MGDLSLSPQIKKRRKNGRKIKKKEQIKDKCHNGKRKLLFLENIGDHNTPREVMLKNLINVLEKNGFKIIGKK